MSNERYLLKHYIIRSEEEMHLMKCVSDLKAQNLDTRDVKAELRRMRAIQRGITMGKREKSQLSEDTFVQYLLSVFSVIKVSDNIAFYNYKKRRYQFLTKDVYLGFFKRILDEVDREIWTSSLEGAYCARFIRDVDTNLESWSVPKDKIVFLNGVYDIQKRIFTEGANPKIYNFESSPVLYDAEAKCPRFKKFMKEITEGNEELQKVIQQMCGYTFMYGSSPKQVIFLLLGAGRNGKGVLTNILTNAHGQNYVSSTSISGLQKSFGLSAVYDKVLNVSAENDATTIMDTSILKTCTGGDTVQVELKYKNAFTAKVYSKFIISSNEVHFNDSSVGFAERLIPIPFNVPFVNEPRPETKEKKLDPNLEKKLTKELSGIVNYFLEGLAELMDNNLVFQSCELVDELKEKLLSEANPVKLFFTECIEVSSDARTKKTKLRDAFYVWANENRINIGLTNSSAKFYGMLESILAQEGLPDKPYKSHGYDCYRGISLKVT